MNIEMNTVPVVPFRESLRFMRNASVFMAENFHRYGDFYRVTLPTHRIHAIANPEVLQHVLIRNESNYIKSRLYWKQLKAILGDALGTIEGEEWVWLKKLQLKAFTHDKITDYLENAIIITDKYLDEWENIDGSVDISVLLSQLNVAILMTLLFGYENSELCNVIASYIANGQEIINYRSRFPWNPFIASLNGKNARYKSYLKFFDGLAKDVIHQTTERPKLELLIDILLEESEMMKHGGRLNIENIRNEIIIHIGAGTETAAVALGWTLYLLDQHRDVQVKLRKEIADVLHGQKVKAADYSELSYTGMVLNEALRMYPPSHGLIRDAIDDDEIGNNHIRPGDTMFISSYALHRNPALWLNPEEFKPERFATEPGKYAFLPYGAGRHTCIGRHLAHPMLVFTLASFIQRFDFTIQTSPVMKPRSVSTLKPDSPLIIHLKKRNSP